jgi:hypothetical protein
MYRRVMMAQTKNLFSHTKVALPWIALADCRRARLHLEKAKSPRAAFPVKLALSLCGLLALSTPVQAQAQAQTGAGTGLNNAIILVIRHGEQADKGTGLSKAGEKRAKAYVDYFKNYTVDSAPFKPDYLFSTADSKESCRTRLTIEPFSKAVGLPINSDFQYTDVKGLAGAVQAKPPGKQFLICWHHGEIPQLLSALGANSGNLIPGNKWPEKVYDWVIQLRYDANGRVTEAKRITEDIKVDGKRKK